MFERFTDRARRVVVLAQEESRLLDHNYIGTEHLLLGLLRDEQGIAAQALTALGVTPERARTEVEELVGRGGQSPSGHIPFTPRAKTVLELSLREALQLGHNYIGTEHLLLGLVREGKGVGVQVLDKLGAPAPAVRETVIELLQRYAGAAPGTAAAEPVAGPRCVGCRSDLASTLSVHTVRAKGDAPAPDVDVAVVYCRACGRAIGVLPHSSAAAG